MVNILLAPEDFTVPVVKDPDVYVVPLTFVLYDAIAEPYAIVGDTTTLNFDSPLIGFPYVVSYPILSVTVSDTEGLTDAGILQLIVLVFVPIVAPVL